MFICLHALELTLQWGDAAMSNPEVLRLVPATLFSSALNAAVLIALVVISEFKPWKRKR